MRLATLFDRSPFLCGACAVCNACPSRLDRYREYRANLDEGEEETLTNALAWMELAYPRCAIDPRPPPGSGTKHLDFSSARLSARQRQEAIRINKPYEKGAYKL